MRLILDIHSKKPWPSNQLSNFAEAPFTLDGLRFTCMESFLQSLKDPLNQEDYQSLTAREAKERGTNGRRQATCIGEERHSEEMTDPFIGHS